MKKIILGMVFFCSMAFSADAPVIAVKQDVEKVFKLVSPHFDNKKKSFGTAFYISKTRLLTAAHTLKDSKEQWIEKDGQAIPCKIVRCDFKEDIAILETKQENKEFFKLVSKIKVIGFARVIWVYCVKNDPRQMSLCSWDERRTARERKRRRGGNGC